MNRINEYLEPGDYTDEKGNVVVVLDVLNYHFNPDKNLPEALPDPVVVVRDLVSPHKEHRRYGIELSVFKQKYITHGSTKF